MKTVAVMQSYFAPYAGYFRIFTAADIVVAFDCVQFPQRGWVHRNQFRLANGKYAWLTLPLAPCPRSTLIQDLQFRPNPNTALAESAQRFPGLRGADDFLRIHFQPPALYLQKSVELFAGYMGLPQESRRSSLMDIDPNLRAQDRVIAICKSLGADHYVNPSGGRALYDAATFAKNGIQLGFLAPYTGSYESILTRLLTENAQDVADEIRRESTVEWMS